MEGKHRAQSEEEEGVVDHQQHGLEGVEVGLRVGREGGLQQEEGDTHAHGGERLLPRQLGAVWQEDEDVHDRQNRLAEHDGGLPPEILHLVALVQVAVPSAKVQVVEPVLASVELEEEADWDQERVEDGEKGRHDHQVFVSRCSGYEGTETHIPKEGLRRRAFLVRGRLILAAGHVEVRARDH